MSAMRRMMGRSGMASRWRRRRMCVLIHDQPVPAALREVSATGAFLETNVRPEIGTRIELHHPEAGAIAGIVRSVAKDGIGIDFDVDIRSVGFALAAIAADMSHPEL
ncbi:MAG TPA: PilZ domain-containing protein [Allosphingosinicella sp.]|nr:PilZ domain-containing protein [Allosphingosinicella sp.]